jgi:sulfoxide reductase catalytic subunit YedY
MRGAGALAFSSLVLAACGGVKERTSSATSTSSPTPLPPTATPAAGLSSPTATATAASPTATNTPAPETVLPETDELGDSLTSFEGVTNYNNYYEFTTDKEQVAFLAKDFKTSPWTVEVGGLVHNPRTFDLDDFAKFDQEDRVYRLRCVEGWSMVIPWLGFPLARLLNEVEPMSTAKYVRFETLYDPEQLPGQEGDWYNWPYVEGLRLDEAMNDLAILSTGLYGKQLLPQNGAPIRLVVPWKYGFKSIKSIVKIDLVEEMPVSLWMSAAPNEYGFYANVNPDVSHPRWSQSTERRIGEFGRRQTLPFNGYAEEVADLYAGMDLAKNY